MSASTKALVKKREPKTRNSTAHADKTNVPALMSPPIDQIYFLQRTVGNREVERLLRPGATVSKLKVNEPDDRCEQEADRIAHQVMAAPARHVVGSPPRRIQRSSGQSGGPVASAPASVDRALASPGTPLGPALRQDMEQRFGHDFSRVRLHTGAVEAQSAQDVSAVAYTVGHDIVFGADRFAPDTSAGRRLIAHELMHVVQQSGATGATIRRQADPKRTAAADDQPPLFTAADPGKRSDKRFARQQGQRMRPGSRRAAPCRRRIGSW